MPTILIVEDHEPSRDALSRRFLRRGHRVLVAGDGADGVALAASERPDVILMDLALPGIDGWEATRRLKADDRTRHIPIIVLSAHAMAEDRDAALAAGADDFDSKPVRFDTLLQKVDALIARSSRV